MGCAQNLPEQRVVKISVLAPAKSNVLAEGYKNDLTVVHRLGSDGWAACVLAPSLIH